MIPMTDPDGTVHHAQTEQEAMELQLAGYTRQQHMQRAYVPAEGEPVADRAYVPPDTAQDTGQDQDVTPADDNGHPADAVNEQPAKRRRS